MHGLKRLLVAAIWIFGSKNSAAQSHQDIWLRNTLVLPVGKNTTVEGEFQHRRQNGFQNRNMFSHNLMFAFRGWLHYQYNPNTKFSVSPFAWFSNYRMIRRQADETVAPDNEIRISIASELQHEMSKRFFLVSRNALEYRLFSNPQPNIARLRTRWGGRWAIGETIRLTVFDEVFFNLTGTAIEHFFDHNRMGVNIECRVSRRLKFDAGYIYLTRLPLNSRTTVYENNVFLNVTYELKKRTGKNAGGT